MKFKITIILDVEEQEIEDMKYNVQNYIKEDIEDDCLYIEYIETIEEEEIEYTCCGVEITEEIKKTGRCPKCSENI